MSKKRLGQNPFEERKLPFIKDSREESDTSKIAGKDTSNITSTSTSKSASISKSAITDKSAGISTSNGKSAITIARKSKSEDYVKMTHYFRADQLKALDRLHKQSGRDKSELVRMAIDLFVERARVE